jgi:hypothetical protein
VQLADAFAAQMHSRATNYATNDLLVTFGCDFAYSNAQINFKNMDYLMVRSPLKFASLLFLFCVDRPSHCFFRAGVHQQQLGHVQHERVLFHSVSLSRRHRREEPHLDSEGPFFFFLFWMLDQITQYYTLPSKLKFTRE